MNGGPQEMFIQTCQNIQLSQNINLYTVFRCSQSLAPKALFHDNKTTIIYKNLRDLRNEPAGNGEHADDEGEPLSDVHHTLPEVLVDPGRVHGGSQFGWACFGGVVDDQRPVHRAGVADCFCQAPRPFPRHLSPMVTFF